MNNSNALAEIQSKYQDCNLLIPSATSVQINPFYKCTVMEVFRRTPGTFSKSETSRSERIGTGKLFMQMFFPQQSRFL